MLGTFRVAEDGTYADPKDATFTLPDGARIGVMHPLEVDAPTLARWGQTLSDYEVLQPFAQLGREVPRDTTLADTEKLTPTDTLVLLGLERRGWRRGSVGDGGVVSELEKQAGPLRATLWVNPGICAGDPKMYPTQTPDHLDFTSARSGTVDDPDPIFLAEVIADLRAVRALA